MPPLTSPPGPRVFPARARAEAGCLGGAACLHGLLDRLLGLGAERSEEQRSPGAIWPRPGSCGPGEATLAGRPAPAARLGSPRPPPPSSPAFDTIPGLSPSHSQASGLAAMTSNRTPTPRGRRHPRREASRGPVAASATRRPRSPFLPASRHAAGPKRTIPYEAATSATGRAISSSAEACPAPALTAQLRLVNDAVARARGSAGTEEAASGRGRSVAIVHIAAPTPATRPSGGTHHPGAKCTQRAFFHLWHNRSWRRTPPHGTGRQRTAVPPFGAMSPPLHPLTALYPGPGCPRQDSSLGRRFDPCRPHPDPWRTCSGTMPRATGRVRTGAQPLPPSAGSTVERGGGSANRQLTS